MRLSFKLKTAGIGNTLSSIGVHHISGTSTKTCWKRDCHGVETLTKYTIKMSGSSCQYVLTTDVTTTINEQSMFTTKSTWCGVRECNMPDCPENDSTCWSWGPHNQ